jgi:hypothetical protein
VEEADLLNPGPARHVRLSARAEQMLLEGRLTSPQQVVTQLAITDITGQHLRTPNALFDMAQRLAATSDPQMSTPTDDKRTLGEVQQVVASSSARLAVVARLLDSTALRPLARRAVANRQQFTRLEQYYRIAGDMARELGADRMMVQPQDLAGRFDYVAHSGVLPPDPANMAGVWTRLLEATLKAPQLLAPGPDGKALDLREVFNETARNAGVRHIEAFYRDVRVEQDAALAAAVQAGNAVPMDAAQAEPDGRIAGAGIQGPMVPVGVDLRDGGMA